MRKSTSPYAASSPTSRQGRNRTSGAPSTLPPQSAATEKPPALPRGDPCTLAKGNVLPQIHQNNNPPVFSLPSLTSGTVSGGIILSLPLPHILPSTIGHNMSPVTPYQCFALLRHLCRTTNEWKGL